MIVSIYVFVWFIVFFFTYKKNIEILKEKRDYYTDSVELKEFWIILIFPMTWVLSIPMLYLWKLMEKITKL